MGLDIEMAHLLAEDLGVALELVPLGYDSLFRELNAGHCDIIMSGAAVTPEGAQHILFSTPIRDETLAIVTEDYQRQDFTTLESVQGMAALNLGIDNLPYYIKMIRKGLPNASITILEGPEDYFSKAGAGLDGYVTTAESGFAWTLLYPEYAVVIPRPVLVKVPLAYAMAAGDEDMARMVNAWVDLKKKDGTVQRLYDYWVLGKNAGKKQARWSVIRDVLGWVD